MSYHYSKFNALHFEFHLFKAIAVLRRGSISHDHEGRRVKCSDKLDRRTMAGWCGEYEELDGRLVARGLHAPLATHYNREGTLSEQYLRHLL